LKVKLAAQLSQVDDMAAKVGEVFCKRS